MGWSPQARRCKPGTRWVRNAQDARVSRRISLCVPDWLGGLPSLHEGGHGDRTCVLRLDVELGLCLCGEALLSHCMNLEPQSSHAHLHSLSMDGDEKYQRAWSYCLQHPCSTAGILDTIISVQTLSTAAVKQPQEKSGNSSVFAGVASGWAKMLLS